MVIRFFLRSNLGPKLLKRPFHDTDVHLVLKPAVLEIGDALLGASKHAKSNLTTIYVKFERADGSVYAVMWIKKSTQAVVGMALPEDTDHERLHDAPKGMTYPGLTRYFTVQNGDAVPDELSEWARAAFVSA